MPPSQTETPEHHMLIIHDATGRRVVQLEDAAYSVGRDSSNAIVLDGESISRQHALLVRLPVPKKGYRYRVLDGNSEGKPSANGIYVNGERCSMQELNKGDIIRFGKNIKATYMTVAMGQVEFLNYLESLSYQSIKSGVTDAKATMVSPELLAGGVNAGSDLNAGTSSSHALDKKDPKFAKATVRLSRDELSKLSKRGKYPVRLWMVGVGAIATIAAVVLLFVLRSPSNAPDPAGATATPSSEVSPQ